MSNKTASLSGTGLRSLFGTLTPSGTLAPTEAASGSSANDLVAGSSAPPPSPPPLVVDAAHPQNLPRILPAGTVIVISQAPRPVAVSSPVYEFPPGPGTPIVTAPSPLTKSATKGTYDFPAPADAAANVVAASSSHLTPQSAEMAADTRGNEPAPSQAAETADAPPLPLTPLSPSVNPPARPTLVVPATLAQPSASGELAAATSSHAQRETPAPAAPAGTATVLMDSGLSTSSSGPIPTPPPTTTATPSVAGLGTGIAITDILRLAAQLSADRLAPAAPTTAASNGTQLDEGRVNELRDRLLKEIDELYQKTIETVGDSPAVVTYCLDLLKKARLALLTGSTAEDLSQAEYYAEEVRSKLSRSQDPIPPGEKKNVVGLLIWSVAFWIFSLPLALLPWFAPTGQIGLWNIKIPVELIPLLATVGWGGTGGVIGTLYNMTWFVQMREYDPAYNLDYFLRPIKGFIAGGVMMLIFTAGIATLNGPQAALGSDKASLGFALVYLGAALAGFKQEYVYEWFDSVLKVFFRTPPATPKQLDAGAK
jgi:hypothetical protein